MVDLQKGRVPVRVLNFSDQPRKLKQGTELAVCESIECVLSSQSCVAGSNCELPEHVKSLYERSITALEPHQHPSVYRLLCEYAHLFSKGPEDLGRTDIVKHRIDTGNAPPIRQTPRRLPLAKREEASQAIRDMREQGVIEPSTSPWASPIVLVRKKDGSTRFCVDYRKLNNVTHKDSYPLPRIDDTLESLSGAKWFSTLDLKSVYWQVELDGQDKEKTAFTTGNGLWQFRVMPFGLCNAPATFERLMEQVLAGLPLHVCLVYLDDILVPGKTFEEELANLRKVFERLKEAKLKLSPKKCTLFQQEVTYLGHVVSEAGVAMDPEKVKVVQTWPIPKTIKEVRSFLGLCSYYRRFIPAFADIAHPLHQYSQLGKSFAWTSDAEQAFQHLKNALTKAPILGYPLSDGEFLLDTDASNTGIGAVLSQLQNGQERVVAYYSRALTRPERQYCVTRRELLAVVNAVQHFHPYLYSRHFTVRSDHAALRWLLNFRHPEGQIARWLQRLQEYDFRIEHRAGLKHGNADALSRRPCMHLSCRYCDRLDSRELNQRELKSVEPMVELTEQCPETGKELVDPPSCCKTTRTPQVAVNNLQVSTEAEPREHAWQPAELRELQMQDSDIQPVIEWMEESDIRPPWTTVAPCSKISKLYWAQWDSLRLRDGVLHRLWENPAGDKVVWQIVLPKTLHRHVLHQLHNTPTAGHLAVAKTLNRVRERFYWARCQQDVRNWCHTCDLCAQRKGPHRKR